MSTAEQQATSNVTKMPTVSDKDVADAEKALSEIGSDMDPGVLNGSVGGPLDTGGVSKKSAASDDDGEEDGDGEQMEMLPVPKPCDEINKLINDVNTELDQIEADRALLNARKREQMESLRAKGVDTDSFEFSRKLMQKDPDKRERMDLSLILVMKAVGKDIQTDWVEDKTTH